MNRITFLMVAMLGLVTFLAGPEPGRAAERLTGSTALVDYIAEPDDSYAWTKRHSGTVGELEYSELRLTSQTWKDIPWKHQLFVIKPAKVDPTNHHALLFITGGSWRTEVEQADGPAKLPREANLFAALANQLNTPVAILQQVPHQPILGERYEDALIAFTFAQFLKSGDHEWPLLLPMVKSAVRGLDAFGEFTKAEWQMDLRTFTVTGASKRGWTTWLTGAVDPRVTAIAPMVIDMLNMGPQMALQKKSFGAYSEQIDDYTRLGLQERINTPPGQTLQRIVDPYQYRDRLTLPKLIMLGTNDPYWPLDAANLYWNDLVGPKYLLYIPNNGHGLNDFVRITGSLNALHQHIARGKQLPEVSWDFVNGGNRLLLRVGADMPVNKVNAWVAASPTRDFRQASWKSFICRKEGNEHCFELEIPADGYAALFGEAVFTDNGPLPYFLSTNVQIVNRE